MPDPTILPSLLEPLPPTTRLGQPTTLPPEQIEYVMTIGMTVGMATSMAFGLPPVLPLFTPLPQDRPDF